MTERKRELPADSSGWSVGIAVGAIVILLIWLAGVAAYWPRLTADSDQDLLVQARQALLQQQPDAAITAAEELLRRNPESTPVLELAAQACTARKSFGRALSYWERIPTDGRPAGINAAVERGSLLLVELKRLSDAETQFRQVARLTPHHLTAHDRLGYILGLAACSWEAIPHRLELIRQGTFEPIHLYLLCMGDSAIENAEMLAEYQAAAPDDPRVLIGLARIALDRQQWDGAEAYLRRAIKTRPDLIEAQAKLGALLLDKESGSAVAAWEKQLPAEADEYPGIWAVRGNWAHQQGAHPEAIRCYWEAVRRDPNHERANYQLSQLLLGVGRAEQAEAFLQRARLLQGYFDAVKIAYTGTDDPAIERAQRLAESLGLVWEAYGWCHLMLRKDPRSNWAIAGQKRLQPQLESLPLTRAAPAANPTRIIDLSEFSLPFRNSSFSPVKGPMSDFQTATSIHFEDLAQPAGLEFQYFNSAVPRPQGPKMYEFTGGGIAVLDYDGDGWSDLYLTQGCVWPFRPGEAGHLDRLYRNRGNGTFEDVTKRAGLAENGFSQGVTAGDFNQDGFPDIYVANIGANRLFQNNGDGTFRDITLETDTGGDRWTASCLLADLNGDRLPDLYAVNYVSGPDVFKRVCPDNTGISRSCSPSHFAGSQDQLYLNLGDGRFREVSAEAGIELPDGKGLGIVALDIDGSGKLSLFISNDAVPNFFFANETNDLTGPPRFSEQAFSRGLALNGDGLAQASMGIAAGDADGDGLLDLFVTTFYNEFNTLYRQQASQLFADETRAAGLAEPSLKQLGFGTQFVDGELDGLPDLIVANGDVDDFRDTGRPYAMRPQYFRNLGGGRFGEVAGEAAGSYFTGQYRGRGLARVDWDRDGRDDVVVSHLDAPVALVTNRTPKVGKFLQLRFVGTISERTAIGTTVTLQAGGRTWVQQLTAGDGYQASNERMLTFGLGNAPQVDRIVIRWPAGMRQEFTAIDVNQTLLCIEGKSKMIRIILERGASPDTPLVPSLRIYSGSIGGLARSGQSR